MIFLCCMDINGGLKGVLIVFIVIVMFPVTLLIGIDTSRVIEREMPSRKPLRIVGRLLAFPRLVMGVVLIGFSTVYPVFGIPELADDLSKGYIAVLPIARLIIAALSFIVGLRYVREELAGR